MIRRRSFLEIVTASGVLAGLGDLGFLAQFPSVSESKIALEPRTGRFYAEIEPLDQYKAPLAANPREGDWTMGASSRLCSCACVR